MSEKNNGGKKKLNFLDCMGFCIGMIIGSGIMVLTGIVIGMTGHGTPYAFLGAAVLAICVMMPAAFLGSAIPSNGAGFYYLKKLIGERAGFFYLTMFVITQVLIATYAKGFADYLQQLMAEFGMEVNTTAAAMVILCVAVVVNLIGLKTSAKVQNVMVALLLGSLTLFILFGLPQVNWTTLSPSAENILPNGIKNFLVGVALLSFATGGAKFIAENGDEIENPGKNIPRAMMLSTIIVAVFYAFIGVVASGVLPVDQVAFQPLSVVARQIFPFPVYVIFVVGGAMFALITTLNGTLSWVTRGLQASAKEGWLPEIFARENKGGTPVVVLMIFFAVGAIPILSGMDTGTIAKMGVGIDMLCEFMLLVACFMLPKRFPKEHANAPFKLQGKPFYILLTIVGILMLGTAYVNLEDINDTNVYIAIVAYLAFILVLTQVLYKTRIEPRRRLEQQQKK